MNSPVVVPVVPVVEKTKGRGKKAKVSTDPVVDAVVQEKSKSTKKLVAKVKSDSDAPADDAADADDADDAEKPRKNLIAKHALLHAFTLHLAKTSLDSGLFDQDLFDRFLASHSFFLDTPSLHNLFLQLDFKILLKNAKIACKNSRKPTVSPDAPSLPAKKAKKEKAVKAEGEVKEKKPRKPRQPKVTVPEGEAVPEAPPAVADAVKEKEVKEKKPRAKKTTAPPAAEAPAQATEAPAAEATEAPPKATNAVKEKKARQTKAKNKPEAEPVAVVPTPELATESHEGELEVRELVFEGVTYLLDDSNILYANDDTFEVVGKYDPIANAVVLNK